MSRPSPRWATVAEAAEYLRSSDDTIYRMIHAGRIERYGSGKRFIRVDLNEIDAAMGKPDAK